MISVAPEDFVPAWSLRREREYDFCPRGYFLRYYAARGGHDTATADRRTRSLYFLRSLISKDVYLQALINNAMRQIFYSPPDMPERTLFQVAAGNLRRELASMIVGDNGIGKRLPVLEDVTRSDLRPERLRRELESALKSRCAVLEAGDWKKVLSVPRTGRLHLAQPFTVYLGELACYSPAILSWQDSGYFCILEGLRHLPEGENAELTALLHRYHVLATPGMDAGKVHSYAFDDEGKLTEFGSDISPSQLIRRVVTGAAKIIPRRAMDGRWHEVSFPPEPSKCPSCVFRSECDAEKYESGD